MKIKDESELARVMGRALASYANRVENGEVTPFLKFIEGATTLNVNILLNEDGTIIVKNIVVKEFADAKPAEPTIIDADVSSEPTKTVPVRKRNKWDKEALE